MKLHCIADEDTVRGFRLAGIGGDVVVTQAEASAALARVVARRDVGLVIVTQAVAALVHAEVDTIRQTHDGLVIAEVPGPEGRRAGDLTLRQQVQSALGIRVEAAETG